MCNGIFHVPQPVNEPWAEGPRLIDRGFLWALAMPIPGDGLPVQATGEGRKLNQPLAAGLRRTGERA